jgi:SAM-dependent methyltransferase
MPDRAGRAKVFNELAEQYQRFRPEYPPELVEAVVSLADLRPNARLLEIGCGPGQATVAFAARGYAMLCLDPGPRLIELARARVRDYPKVEFRVTTFEDWPLEPAAFDLVLAASAFHWVAPGVGFTKVAAALKGTGALALCRNAAVGEATDLFADLQEVPLEHAPHLARRWTVWSPPAPEEDATRAEIEETGLFEEVAVRYFAWRRE